MKIPEGSFIIILASLLVSGCRKGTVKNDSPEEYNSLSNTRTEKNGDTSTRFSLCFGGNSYSLG